MWSREQGILEKNLSDRHTDFLYISKFLANPSFDVQSIWP